MKRESYKPAFWRRMFSGGDIFSAIDRGDAEKCRTFLRGDSSTLGHTDELGRTPIHVASHKGRREIVALLLSAGADPRARDANGATPLHWAAVGGDPGVIEELLAAGADIHALDDHSLTPGQLAEMRGHAGIASLLRR